jgi:hypothetical protein
LNVKSTDLHESTSSGVIVGIELCDDGDGLESVDCVAVAVIAEIALGIGIEAAATLVTGVTLAWMWSKSRSVGICLVILSVR